VDKDNNKRETEFRHLRKITKFTQDFERFMKQAENPNTILKKKYDGLAKELFKSLITDADSIRDNKHSIKHKESDEMIQQSFLRVRTRRKSEMEKKLDKINQDQHLFKAAFPDSSHQSLQVNEDKNSLISLKDHPKLRDKINSLKYQTPFHMANMQARANSVISKQSIQLPSLYPDVE